MESSDTKQVSEAMKYVVARIERLPATRYMWAVFLVASFGYFFDFFEVSMLGAVAPSVAKTMGVSTTAGTLLITVTLLGMMVGAAFGGILADKYGRKSMFMITLVGWGSLAFITAFSPNYSTMLTLRIFTGVFLGIEIPTLDSYVNEMMPTAMRGRYFQTVFAVFEWYVPLIFVLSYFIVPISPQAWRYMFIIGGAFAVPIWIGRLILPESPRWLVVSNRVDRANKTLSFMEAHVERNLGKKLPEPNVSTIDLKEIATEKVPVLDVLRGGNLRLSLMWMPIYFLSFFAWYFFITAIPSILVEVGYSVINALTYVVPVAVATAAFAALPIFTIDTRIGRKGTYWYSGIILIISSLLYILIPSPITLIIFGSTNAGMVTIWADVVHQWGPETYSNRIRGTATGFNYAFARLGAAFAPFVGVVVAHTYGLSGVFFVGVLVTIVAMILAWAVPETKKRLLENIPPGA